MKWIIVIVVGQTLSKTLGFITVVRDTSSSTRSTSSNSIDSLIGYLSLPDPLATIRAIHEEKRTALIGPPIIFRDILNHPDRKKYDLISLIYSGLGASPVHSEFLRQLEKEIPIKIIGQVYGMTENAAWLTSSLWPGIDNETHRRASLGRCVRR